MDKQKEKLIQSITVNELNTKGKWVELIEITKEVTLEYFFKTFTEDQPRDALLALLAKMDFSLSALFKLMTPN